MARRPHPLTKWFRAHTAAQNAQLVKLAKTSRPYLRHVTAGRRALSLELAIALEIAAVEVDMTKRLGLVPAGIDFATLKLLAKY